MVFPLHKKTMGTLGALQCEYINNSRNGSQTVLKARENKNVFSCHLKAA